MLSVAYLGLCRRRYHLSDYALSHLVVVHKNFVAVLQCRRKHKLCQLVLEILLYGAFQRAGTELHVAALGGNEVAGAVGEGDDVSHVGGAAEESRQLDIDDSENGIAVEAVEDYHIVDSVEEFRRESLVQCFGKHAVAVFAVDFACGESHTAAEFL